MANDLRWGVDGRVREHIRRLAVTTDWTAAQILRDAQREYGNEKPKVEMPGVRAVQKAVKRYRATTAENAGERWRLGTLDPEDDALVLPTLRLGVGRPSISHAREIVGLRRSCPTLSDSVEDLELVWYLARLLDRARQIPDEPGVDGLLSDIELLLAYAPWEDKAARLSEAIDERRVPFGVAHFGGYDREAPGAALKKRRTVRA